MPRQVKIGFDRVPAPLTKSYHQLVDIKGIPLTDAAGNPLVTQEIAQSTAFTTAINSLPAVVGNSGASEAIPVTEVFNNESEVSTTLLGVTRAEEQLSLFADVSTYGLDRSNWNYYTTGHGRLPHEWYLRKNPIFGNRGPAEFNEETSEQALYLKSFPVQYRFPEHPRGTSEIPDPISNFGKYIRFIALGRWLYEIWKDIDLRFAENNFLNEGVSIIKEDKSQLAITKSSWLLPNGGWTEEIDFRSVIYGVNGYSTQAAMDQIERWTLFYFKIRNDEDVYPTYTEIRLGQTVEFDFKTDREVGDLNFRPQYVGEYQVIQRYARADFTRPGGSENNETTGVLESKRTFRYQPGRVSGFTFGIRLKNNPREQSDKIEWGCANDTDQYMFQVTGSQWNIIRRSTLRIPDSVLEDPNGMNLVPADDFRTPVTDLEVNPDTGEREEPQQPPGRDKSERMYEVRIPRSKWNGDPLNGSGRSGYIANLENVTMYKIEFSWYGAIGAKFYAYVPSGSGEARWVLLHTWIIENQLLTPSLKAADFKFRYVTFNKKTSSLVEPSFIYKYGSSYYIDGGDEGSITLSSTTSDSRLFSRSVSSDSRGAVVALHPKSRILNSFGYDPENANYQGITNNKKIYPLTLAAISTQNVRIDISKVIVSSDGQHGTKSISLVASDRFEKDVALTISNYNTLNFIDPADTTPPYTIATPLTALDQGAKLVGSGLINAYVDLQGTGIAVDPTQARLTRRYNNKTYAKQQDEIGERVTLNNYDVVDIEAGDDTNIFTANLTNLNRSVVASSRGIQANRFKIHFLNPFKRDGRFSTNRHAADFAIGVITDQPTVSTDENGIGYLTFANKRVWPNDPPEGSDAIEYGNYFDYNNELHVQWGINRIVRNTRTTAELYEADSGDGRRLEQDYRVDQPEDMPFNGRYGRSSCIEGTVTTASYAISGIDEPAPGTAGNPPAGVDWDKRITFASIGIGASLPISDNALGNAEVGINGVGTGYVFVTRPQVPAGVDPAVSIAFIRKRTPDVPDYDFSGVSAIEAKIVTLQDDNKISMADDTKDFVVSDVFQFNVQPLYLFFAMNSNARINNIIIEEFSETTSSTHVPDIIGAVGQGAAPGLTSSGVFNGGIERNEINDIFEDSSTVFNQTGNESSNIAIVKDVQTTSDRAPSNFIDGEGLSGIRFDTQTDLPLADGIDIYSFYVGANEAVDFSLENIFNIDRAVITPGLFNNEAYYFKATPVASTGPEANVSVQMTLTVKEQ